MKFLREVFENDTKKIIFFGFHHTQDSSLFSFLKNEIINLNPDIILIEGNFNKANFNSLDEAIKKGGEMGYISFLAKEQEIKIVSNDPSFKEDVEFIERKYNRDLAFLYMFLREKSFNKRMGIKKSDESILTGINAELGGLFFVLNDVGKIFFDIFGEEINFDEDYSDFFNPTLKINLFNKISLELGEFRDEFMLEEIRKFLKENNNILIFKGFSHLETTRDRIKSLLK